MANDKLTDTAIRKAKASEKSRKLADGGGLYLELHPNGEQVLALEVPDRRQGEALVAGRLSGGEPGRRAQATRRGPGALLANDTDPSRRPQGLQDG